MSDADDELRRALAILARVHTRTDSAIGYSVLSEVAPHRGIIAGISTADYAKAWGTVRRALGLPVEPDNG